MVFPECVSGANKEPEEVSVAAKLPPKATSRSHETRERDDFFSEAEDEVSKGFDGSSGQLPQSLQVLEPVLQKWCHQCPCLLLQPKQNYGL